MASRPASAPDGAAQPRSGSSATGVRPVTRTRRTGEVMRRVRTGSVGHEEDDCPARTSSRRCHSIPCNRVGPDVNLRGTRRLSLTASCCRPRSLTQRGLDVASVSVTVALKATGAHRLDIRENTKDVDMGPTCQRSAGSRPATSASGRYSPCRGPNRWRPGRARRGSIEGAALSRLLKQESGAITPKLVRTALLASHVSVRLPSHGPPRASRQGRGRLIRSAHLPRQPGMITTFGT